MRGLVLFLLAARWLCSHSIVFVHIGPSLPEHISYTIAQARLFNPSCPIYLIANQEALVKQNEALQPHEVIPISCESLPSSAVHQRYSACAPNWKGGDFWVYASERFFYLEELISQYQLTDVFHLENDVLLFADLEEFLPAFQQHYAGMIGATFENDYRGVAGLVYISELNPLTILCAFFPECLAEAGTDMEILGKFKDQYRKVYIDHLPIIPPDYAKDHPLQFYQNWISKEPEVFSNHFDDFGAVFDAAAWGIYLGGWDRQFHEACHPGEISPYCVFNPSLLGFHWGMDQKGRKIPCASYNDQTIRILNLHMTNKVKIPSICSQ